MKSKDIASGSKRRGAKASGLSRRWLALAIVVLIVASYGLYVYFFLNADRGLRDVFAILQEQGYEVNRGLSGLYTPGTIIQTAELGPNGKSRPLDSPLVFKWGSDCFPDFKPQDSQFVLPESSGTASASLGLNAGNISTLLPVLGASNASVSNYELKFDNARVQTFARADLSGQFSDDCVEALDQAIDDGDDLAWLNVIVESVVADSLTLEIQWKSSSEIQGRADLKEKARQGLSAVVSRSAGGSASGTASVEFTADDEKSTVFSAQGLVVLGYRARPLQSQE